MLDVIDLTTEGFWELWGKEKEIRDNKGNSAYEYLHLHPELRSLMIKKFPSL